MSDSPLPPSTVVLPAPPQQADEFFRIVFAAPVMGDATGLPSAPIVGEAGAYGAYVRQLALGLMAESTRLAATEQDEQTLERVAGDLLKIEIRRREALAPYLAEAGQAQQARNLPTAWSALRDRVRNDMGVELEAIRDARLRLEFRKAELVNKRKGPGLRVVLRGGAQITLHFGQRRGDAAAPD